MSAHRLSRRRLFAATGVSLALAAGAVAVTAAPASAAGSAGTTFLSGAQQVPPNASTASGTFAYFVSGDRICYALTARGLSTPAAAAHIHKGAAGTNGPVVQPLAVKPSTSFATAECVTNREVAMGIKANPSAYYVNVHDATYPGGEIRGQLK